MKLRVKTIVDECGRSYYVQRQYNLILFKVWVNVSSFLGHHTEGQAKDFAEDYAKGDWVTDQATFNERK